MVQVMPEALGNTREGNIALTHTSCRLLSFTKLKLLTLMIYVRGCMFYIHDTCVIDVTTCALCHALVCLLKFNVLLIAGVM